jgi:hypothetical protein
MTDYINILAPKDQSQDIFITLMVSGEKGIELVKKFNLRRV